MSLGFFISSLPWWVAAPLLQLAVLVVGMALDETYVNRTTVLTGAIATHMHIFVAGDVGLLVSLYADVGLVLGAYGLYAYVIDGYVANWFRLLAYFVYSPLSVFAVILMAGPTLFGIEPLVVPALAAAGYGNYQFREYLAPREPYYFGPESQLEFENVLEFEAAADAPAETATDEPSTAETQTNDAVEPTAVDSSAETAATGSGDGGATAATAAGGVTTDGDESKSTAGTETVFERSTAEPVAAADSSERGILPRFMRRL